MMLAQKLYEGIELGSEGSVGLITYMRTDSTRVSDDALADVRNYIGSNFGPDYLPEKPVFYRSKKDAQDAHEAIRPTQRPTILKRSNTTWGPTSTNSTSSSGKGSWRRR
jgi:DNA topoisomerase-1